MSNDRRSPITPFELDADEQTALRQSEHPHSFLPEPQAADDEAAALLSGTNGPSSAARGASSSVSTPRHRRALLLSAAAALLCLMLTFAVAAVWVARQPRGAAHSAATAPPSDTAAPASETAVPWGMSMYDVPVPQNVSMPPYTTYVRSSLLQPRRRASVVICYNCRAFGVPPGTCRACARLPPPMP